MARGNAGSFTKCNTGLVEGFRSHRMGLVLSSVVVLKELSWSPSFLPLSGTSYHVVTGFLARDYAV